MSKRVQAPVPTFKYYLHDSVDKFRLQLIGNLGETQIAELSGCWKTASTILGSRTLLLDLRELKATDEAGREWLLAMVREGAQCAPESYFRDHLAGSGAAPEEKNVAAKLGSFFKGAPRSQSRADYTSTVKADSSRVTGL